VKTFSEMTEDERKEEFEAWQARRHKAECKKHETLQAWWEDTQGAQDDVFAKYLEEKVDNFLKSLEDFLPPVYYRMLAEGDLTDEELTPLDLAEEILELFLWVKEHVKHHERSS